MRLLLWLLSLAALSVGARNFEQGISIDGPLYASIARNIARSSEWFRLDGGIPDFLPFAEHPHLGFWLQALIFKILPAADWSARISGHIFYVAALALAYKITERLFSARAASFTVLILWSWGVFSNYFSNFYLDPGCLVFGTLFIVLFHKSLEEDDLNITRNALLAGFFLGLAFLQKGLAALGFGPVALVMLALAFKRSTRPASQFLMTTIVLAVCLTILGTYFMAVQFSTVPEFFDIYWTRQFTGRFGRQVNFSGLLSLKFWSRLNDDTHKLLLVVPFAMFALRKHRLALVYVLSFFASFLLMYATNRRTGGQYWLMLMPPLAIVLGAGLDEILRKFGPKLSQDPQKLQRITQALSLALVCLLQYLPISTHTPRKPIEADTLVSLKKIHSLEGLTLVRPHNKKSDFTLGASLAWYTDLKLSYLDRGAYLRRIHEIQPRPTEAYLVLGGRPAMLPQGLCETPHAGASQILVPCIIKN